MDHSEFKPGDYIVGSYSSNGQQLKAGKVVGDQNDAQELQQMMIDHAGRTGGSALPVTSKHVTKPKGRPKNKAPALKELEDGRQDYTRPLLQYEAPVEEPKQEYTKAPQAKRYPIFLYNQMGKIKMQVEGILESDMAFCLVFREEDDIVLYPKAGESLKLIDVAGNEHEVYYADSSFTWLDDTKKLMVLFKNNE